MKKFFVFLLVVICLGMGAGVVYMKSSEDNEGPKITFEEGKDTNYTSDMTEEDLLKDVKAQDDRDGDVTESLTVETIYPKNDGKQVSVIFVAKDKNNNVTKKEFTMEAQDGSAENPQLGLIDNDGLAEDGDSTDTTEPAEETDMQDGTEADSTDAESGDSAEGELTPEEQAQKTQEDKIEQLSPQVAMRHIHMAPKDAQAAGVHDGDVVSVKADNERGTIFNQVKIRVDDSFTLEMHIDTDEANAARIATGNTVTIIK